MSCSDTYLAVQSLHRRVNVKHERILFLSACGGSVEIEGGLKLAIRCGIGFRGLSVLLGKKNRVQWDTSTGIGSKTCRRRMALGNINQRFIQSIRFIFTFHIHIRIPYHVYRYQFSVAFRFVFFHQIGSIKPLLAFRTIKGGRPRFLIICRML